MILDWPVYLRDKLKANDDEPTTYWSLLREAASLELGPEGLTAGGKAFSARVIHAEPGGDEVEAAEVELPLPVLGRRAIAPSDAPDPDGLTPDQIAPSTLHAETASRRSIPPLPFDSATCVTSVSSATRPG